MRKKIFLETTIQIERNFSYNRVRKRINDKLDGNSLYTSSFVIGEIKSNLLFSATHFYNLLLQSDSTNEALDRLSRSYPFGFSSRKKDLAIKVFAYLSEDGNMLKESLLKRLRLFIDHYFHQKISGNIQEIYDNTECIRAKQNPIFEDGVYKLKFSCKNTDCKICEFINNNQENISKIINECNVGQNKNLEEMISVLKDIHLNGKEIKGKSCWKLGDIIISNEIPDKHLISTTNKCDYEPICSILGIEFFDI